MKTTFPIFKDYSISTLIHVGEMDIAKKNDFSHEGNGLSVSICPLDWTKITKSYSDISFSLTKENSMFLDFHNLTKENYDMILKWAIKEKYIVETDGYFFEEESGDFDCTFIQKCTTLNEVFENLGYEVESLTEEEQEEILSDYNVQSCKIQTPTDKMVERLGWTPGINMVETYLVTFYAEEVLDFDGVYWDDILDTSILSAPRGVIFNSKLSSFQIKEVKTESEEFFSLFSEELLSLLRN